jgi:hypothetical protein
MTEISAKRSAIEAALPNVATVLCALIAGYADPTPHEWQPTPDSVDFPTRIENGRWLRHRDRGIDHLDNWYSVVSSANLDDGVRRWLIGWKPNPYPGWFGAGVTTEKDNAMQRGTSYSQMSSGDASWILRGDGYCQYHAGRFISDSQDTSERLQIDDWPSAKDNLAGQTLIEFVADPKTLQVVAKLADRSVVLITAATADQFYSLRPCVVVGGRIDAVIMSSDQ